MSLAWELLEGLRQRWVERLLPDTELKVTISPFYGAPNYSLVFNRRGQYWMATVYLMEQQLRLLHRDYEHVYELADPDCVSRLEVRLQHPDLLLLRAPGVPI